VRAARRYAGLIFCSFFARTTAGCIETIVHTTGMGISAPTGARGWSLQSEKIKKVHFPQFQNSKPQKIKKSLQKFKIFKTSKVYTPHAGNSTKINHVN